MLTSVKLKSVLFLLVVIIFFSIIKFNSVNCDNDTNVNVNNKVFNNYQKIGTWFWNKEDYPNPVERPAFCKRTTKSFVCDPDMILTQKQANQLDEIVKKIPRESKCYCTYCPPDRNGLSFGIALVKHIFQEYNVFPSKNAENFAEFLRKKWKLGICENDVIILVITHQDQVSIVEGNVAQTVLSTNTSQEIFVKSKIHFIKNDYFKGLESMMTFYHDFLTKNQIQNSPKITLKKNDFKEIDNNNDSKSSPSNLGLIIGLSLGFLAMISIILVLLVYIKKRVNQDENEFQFKGISTLGYWLNSKEKGKPKPVVGNTIIANNNIYEPCSIQDEDEDENYLDQDNQMEKL